MSRASRLPAILLLRSFVIIAAAILLVGLVLDGVLVWLVPPRDGTNLSLHGPALDLMTTVMQGRDAATIRAELERLQGGLSAPVSVYQVADIAGFSGLQPALEQGRAVSLLDNRGQEFLYRLLPDSDLVLALGPLPAAEPGRSSLETLVIIAYYLLVSVILFLWIRPFYRDLDSLRFAASSFGRGDLSPRVQVGPGSSILPVALSFNRMAERIQYLMNAHQELINAVSHELRTPLARFKFSLEMLGKMEDSARRAEYLGNMKTDVQELEALIDELLSYARLSEDNLQVIRSPVDLTRWLRQLLDAYGEPAVPIHYRCRGDADDSLASFNPDMMARAINNVLRNSLRYAETAITIETRMTPAEVEIRILDDGPGIPAAMREKVFEPFSRLDTSRDRKSGGYGLGLAIARRILQRHDGNIVVEDNPPHGAAFIARFPRR